MTNVLKDINTNEGIIMNNLVEEVLRGEHEVDRLINTSLDFSKEMQAMYFTNTRNNMQSDFGHTVMEYGQQLIDIKLMKECGING